MRQVMMIAIGGVEKRRGSNEWRQKLYNRFQWTEPELNKSQNYNTQYRLSGQVPPWPERRHWMVFAKQRCFGGYFHPKRLLLVSVSGTAWLCEQ